MNLTLHLTTRCPLRCDYCYVRPDTVAPRDMSLDTAVLAIELAARRSPDQCGVVFFGGEPLLLAARIREIVAWCRRRETRLPTRFHFKVTTNGIPLDDAFLEFAVAEDVFIALSLDGLAAAHDAHRVTEDREPTHAIIAGRARALLARRPYAPVMMTVAPDTVHLYAASVAHLLDLGFRYVIASLDYAGSWSDRALRTLRHEYWTLAGLYEAWTRQERKFYFSPFEVKLASHIHGGDYARERCELGLRQISVAPDGLLYPCVQFARDGSDTTFSIGDVRAGFDEEKRSAFAAVAAADHEACRACAIEARCNHTCGCLNWQATGRLDRVSPVLCEHERLLVPIVDRLGARLYGRRSAIFVQKHYNAMYPLLSLIEDDADGGQASNKTPPGVESPEPGACSRAE
jgi:uncharacterized protein